MSISLRRSTLLAIVVTTLVPFAAVAAGTLKVSTAQNATLGKRVLVTGSGRTLYSLSVETRGRFVCTGACLSTWPPLLLRGGAKPAGVAHLGTIRRPDGRVQATYRGRPLYRFASDRRKGDVGGEGFRDVGVWHATVVRR